MSDKTWACVQSKQDTYTALKHAESEHETAFLQRQLSVSSRITKPPGFVGYPQR